MQEIIELEELGWKALSTDMDSAIDFYSSVMQDNATMLFPGGIRIEGKEKILKSFGAQPWMTFRIEDPHIILLADKVAALSYLVTAQREGSDPYEALTSSIYVFKNGAWKLGYHQHTMA